MRSFYFAGVLSQYLQPYTRVLPGGGAYNEDGEWQPALGEPLQLSGMVQPLTARLKAMEGGNYLESDRILFTTYRHTPGEVLKVDSVSFRVVETTERGYSDVNQYVIRKVVTTHDPHS